jgi:hypothetical protein
MAGRKTLARNGKTHIEYLVAQNFASIGAARSQSRLAALSSALLPLPGPALTVTASALAFLPTTRSAPLRVGNGSGMPGATWLHATRQGCAGELRSGRRLSLATCTMREVRSWALRVTVWLRICCWSVEPWGLSGSASCLSARQPDVPCKIANKNRSFDALHFNSNYELRAIVQSNSIAGKRESFLKLLCLSMVNPKMEYTHRLPQGRIAPVFEGELRLTEQRPCITSPSQLHHYSFTRPTSDMRSPTPSHLSPALSCPLRESSGVVHLLS